MKQQKKHFFCNYDAVIFDFDGTIVDLDIDWESAKETLSEFLKSTDNNLFSLLKQKKIGASEKINLYLEKYGLIFKHDVSNLSREVEEKLLRSWKVKDGAVRNIRRLKDAGIKLFIWTLNTRPVVDKVLKALDIDDNIFVEIISFESGRYVKPDVHYLKKILKEYKIKKPVYIGDSYYDIIASKKANIKYLDFSRTEELFTKFNNCES